MKRTVIGVPLCATTAIPNDPAWPSSPEPSSYAQIGVGGSRGCSCLAICFCVNEYASSPLGVATTIPSPGNGTFWMNFSSCAPTDAAAGRVRAAHGRRSIPPPAAALVCKKLRRVNLRLKCLSPLILSSSLRGSSFNSFVFSFPCSFELRPINTACCSKSIAALRRARGKNRLRALAVLTSRH